MYDKQKWFVYVMAIKVEYRPETVKLPPNFCKTLEKIVKNRLCEHISTHGLQSTTQHGFFGEKILCNSSFHNHFIIGLKHLTNEILPGLDAILLDWSKHVDMTVAKACRVLGLITRISGRRSQSCSHRRDVRLRLYERLVSSNN